MREELTQVADSVKPSSPEAVRLQTKTSFWKRRPVILLGTVALALLFYLALGYLVDSFTHQSTDDAFLSGDVVAIAPRVSGQVSQVFVSDNQPVKTGDLIIQIDPRDFEVQLAQKKAALDSAQANVKLLLASIDLLATQVATAEATAKQSGSEAEADRATAEKASQDLKRAEDLSRTKIISPQEYDAARAAAAAANATWNAGQQKAASDLSKVAQSNAQLEAGRRAWERAQSQAKETSVDVEQAELNLSYTKITAPADGRITRKAVESGDYVQAGQRLLAIVPNEIWVTANFKETELNQIRTNQPAKIKIDALGGRAFDAHVQSIQAGSGAAFSLLPPENAVGNYVKVVQRVPVKLVFDTPPDTGHVLGPGMSVVPSIRVASFDVPETVIAIVALILALLAGFFWSKMAGKHTAAAGS